MTNQQIDELERLAALHTQGVITDKEFLERRAVVLNEHPPQSTNQKPVQIAQNSINKKKKLLKPAIFFIAFAILFVIIRLIAFVFEPGVQAKKSPPVQKEPEVTTYTPPVESKRQVSIKSFRDVSDLRNGISIVRIGSMRKWWSDGSGWMSASNYYEFGVPVDGVLFDNLAFYLESSEEYYVETLKLNLTAFRRYGANYAAYRFMADRVPTLFGVINLPIPKGLLSAIKSKKEFFFENAKYRIETDYDYVPGAKAESYRLIITSK